MWLVDRVSPSGVHHHCLAEQIIFYTNYKGGEMDIWMSTFRDVDFCLVASLFIFEVQRQPLLICD